MALCAHRAPRGTLPNIGHSLDTARFKKCLILWRALGDSNPCYRRERAHPSSNVTGIAPYVEGLPSKQLELARAVVPGATRIGLVDDVNDPKAHPQRREIEAAGKELEIKSVPAEVGNANDIGSAMMPWRRPVSRWSSWSKATCSSFLANR